MSQSKKDPDTISPVKLDDHPARQSTLVRFKAEQYAKIKGDAKTFGKSIPGLLRAAYFDGRVLTPLFSAADAERLMAALNRVGNNLNQIAKHLNSGFREGFEPLLEEAVTHLSTIRSSLVTGHERR